MNAMLPSVAGAQNALHAFQPGALTAQQQGYLQAGASPGTQQHGYPPAGYSPVAHPQGGPAGHASGASTAQLDPTEAELIEIQKPGKEIGTLAEDEKRAIRALAAALGVIFFAACAYFVVPWALREIQDVFKPGGLLAPSPTPPPRNPMSTPIQNPKGGWSR